MLGAGGTYALFNSSAAASTKVSVVAGTASISVTSPLALPAVVLYPGGTIRGPVTVSNTGNTPVALRVTALSGPSPANVFSQALTVGVGAGTAAACAAGTVTPTWSGTFASATAAPIGSLVPIGGSAELCVSVALAAAAPNAAQDLLSGFTLTLDGRQP
ncbi:hypothetical protein GCM10009563_08190 [Subtercola frigoramans]